MVSAESGLTADFNPGDMNDDEVVDMKTTKNAKWVAKLGSQAYGNATVAGGRVAGTNNESPRDPGKKGDRGVVMCLDEKTGDLLQLVIPKLGAGKVSDWEYIGVCSSPAVYGDRAYVVTNRCEVVCLTPRAWPMATPALTRTRPPTSGPRVCRTSSMKKRTPT